MIAGENLEDETCSVNINVPSIVVEGKNTLLGETRRCLVNSRVLNQVLYMYATYGWQQIEVWHIFEIENMQCKIEKLTDRCREDQSAYSRDAYGQQRDPADRAPLSAKSKGVIPSPSDPCANNFETI